MNLEKLGHWVGIVANLGVFAGFLLVAYQLHQNTIGLQSNAAYNSNELLANSDTALMGDTGYAAMAKSMTDPKSLSPDELMQMWAYLSLTSFSATLAFGDYNQGIISEARWLATRETFISYMNHPIGLIWWETQWKVVSDPGARAFYDSVQEGLEKFPRNATQLVFHEMLDAVRALEPTEGSAVPSDRPIQATAAP